MEKEQLLYKIRPKYHQLLGSNGCYFQTFTVSIFYVDDLRLDHLVLDQAQFANPLLTSTYDDEDFVGKTKRLAMIASPVSLGHNVLERYAAYVCVRWLRQLTD